jgi:hypothetical protein
MPSSAAVNAESVPRGLETYRLRDELAQSFAPANAQERLLTTQIAQAWLRLQQAYETERRYLEKNDPLEALRSDFERYKFVTRLVTDCERAWRHAVAMLERTQRRRLREQLASPRPRTRTPAPSTLSMRCTGPGDENAEKIATEVATSKPECYSGFTATRTPARE